MWLSHAALQIRHLQNEHFGEGWRLNKNNITCNGLNQAHGKHSVSVNYCWNKERQKSTDEGLCSSMSLCPIFMSGALRKIGKNLGWLRLEFLFTAANMAVISFTGLQFTHLPSEKAELIPTWSEQPRMCFSSSSDTVPGLHQGVQVIRSVFNKLRGEES